jgi:hypothetical protein
MKTNLTIILSVILLSGCYKEADYDYSAADMFASMTLELTEDTLFADGTASSTLRYAFPLESDTLLTRLNLSCSNCTFAASDTTEMTTNATTLTTGKDMRYLEVKVVASTKATQGVITTELLQYKRQDTVVYNKAYPVEIASFGTSPFYIQNDTVAEVQLQASLGSAGGTASKGHPITLSILSSSSSPVPGFLKSTEVTSDANGNATTVFVFSDVSFTGIVEFKAETLDEASNTLTSTYVLQVID